MSNTSENNKRIAKNTLLLYFRMLLTMLIGLYTSRIVLATLGIEDYGIYNVVGGFVAMFTFLNSSMNVATSRFISHGLGKKDLIYSSKVYNQAVIIHFIIALVIVLLLETAGVWFLYHKLVIPVDRIDAAFWVLQASVISCFLTIISTPDQASIISHEKMSAFAYISIYDAIAKLLIVYLLTVIPFDKLKTYSILSLLILFSDRIIYMIYCRRKFKETHSKLRIEKTLFKEMASFAGWNVMSNMAYLGIEQGMNILLNIFFGPIINAARGVAMQVTGIVRSFVGNIKMAVNPQIYKSYSERNIEYMHQLIIYSSKFSYYAILLLALPMMFIAKDLLEVWLVKVPDFSVQFLILLLIYLLIESFATTLTVGVHSTGKIAKYQLVEALFMLTNIPLAYYILTLGYSPCSVYIVQIIVSLFTQGARLYIALPKIGLSFRKYYQAVIKPIIIVTVLSTILPFSILYANIHNRLLYCILVCLASEVTLLTSILLFGLEPSEKKALFSQLNKRFHLKIKI